MKNVGSFFEYEDERNSELINAFKIQLASKENTNMADVYRKVVDMPCSRFWVSEERASIMMSSMLKGRSIKRMNPTKREMYEEIFRIVKQLRKERPDASLYEITSDAVQSPAPKFYLTPGSAKVIINKIRKSWYEERKHKYRHLFM